MITRKHLVEPNKVYRLMAEDTELSNFLSEPHR